MLAAAAVAGNAHLQGLPLMGARNTAWGPTGALQSHPPTRTFEFTPVLTQAPLQPPGILPSAEPQSGDPGLLRPQPLPKEIPLLETEVPWYPWPSSLLT